MSTPRAKTEATPEAREGTARLFRTVTDTHICPYGVKAKWLLQRHGYAVDDRHLATREEIEAFKREHEVATTPQAFIAGERVGGYDALRSRFGYAEPDRAGSAYRPIMAVFAVALGLALSLSWWASGLLLTARTAEWFVTFSLAMLAMLKLQDIETFSTMVIGYDLLAVRWVPYAYLYPYLEAIAAVLMAGRMLPWLSIPIAFAIGSIGAVSVFSAVYVQKRAIGSACVGGGANVRPGLVSLGENLALVGMAIWMILRPGLM
ncbi:MauE/DoxX family redox-associated membrane protein [Aurantiacibacter spongiae]|uniref:Methylamine utilization protein MauE n=1 Tax=Aurantiacibacter spongiae TaxID=2488860 RepID=A0A3N5CPG0_9SPHN|nr:glutaredoxin [Aurantiacibacter spongiae]RPF70246.1 glutaredoxin [Aurantiacibacter spongiae]